MFLDRSITISMPLDNDNIITSSELCRLLLLSMTVVFLEVLSNLYEIIGFDFDIQTGTYFDRHRCLFYRELASQGLLPLCC